MKNTPCECFLSGKPKQWCERHGCYKSPLEIRKCQISIPEFAVWEECRHSDQGEDCVTGQKKEESIVETAVATGLFESSKSYDNSMPAVQEEDKVGCKSCGGGKRKKEEPSPPPPPPTSGKAPSLFQQGWNFASAVGEYVKSGGAKVSEEEYTDRLKECDSCEWRNGKRCMKCGCFVTLKATWSSADCPIGKWPKIDE
jgi:hypothetical protein